MKKLLIIISTLTFGGAEIQTLELANGLLDHGYSVDIVVLDHRTDVINKARPEIRFHVMNKRSYLDFEVLKKLKSLLLDIKPDIALCVNLYSTLYLRLARSSNLDSLKTAVVFHSTSPRDLIEDFKRWYLLRIAKSMNCYIFVSKNQMEYWIKHWRLDRNKAVVIYNGIDIKRFHNFMAGELSKQDKKEQFINQGIVIGNCSNFRKEKSHQDLIEAIYRLKEKGCPVKLLLIGDGYMRETMEKQIHAKGLENEVFITGFVSDIRPYLAQIDIFVLTSTLGETLSIAAIESLAMKKAAVLSDLGGASEIVSEGLNGYLFPAGDVNALVRKLDLIIKDKKWQTMGEIGYRHACNNFHKDVMVQAYDSLFRSLAGTESQDNNVISI